MKSYTGNSGPRPSREDVGILLFSFAILLVELLLTRIFSVVMFHHMTFMAVSLAMMGLGFGGLFVNIAAAVLLAPRVTG